MTIEFLHTGVNQIIREVFSIDLESFYGTVGTRNDVFIHSEGLLKALGNVASALKSLDWKLEKIARISRPTGLTLSHSTLVNLQAILQGNVPKIDPSGCDAGIFKDVLGVRNSLAFELEQFFEDGNDSTGLEDVQGLTAETFSEIKRIFILN